MENIKIYTDEYSLFMKKYKQLHENIIIDLDYCYRELDVLLHSDGGFHADMISEKLDIMMEILKCHKTGLLKSGFLQMENDIRSFLDTIYDADEL